jgi:hypothetical protein
MNQCRFESFTVPIMPWFGVVACELLRHATHDSEEIEESVTICYWGAAAIAAIGGVHAGGALQSLHHLTA